VCTTPLQPAHVAASAIFAFAYAAGQAAVFGQIKGQAQPLAFQRDGHGSAFALSLAHVTGAAIRMIAHRTLTFYG
jgi:hypothetical protein